MLEKLSPQIRLALAVGLSMLFFFVYEYFMPAPKVDQNNTQKTTLTKQQPAPDAKPASMATATNQQSGAQAGNVIARIKLGVGEVFFSSEGTLSQVVLEGEKFTDETGKHVKLFSPLNTKPLSLKFADKSLEDAASKTAYSASSSFLDASKTAQTLILTQKIGTLTMTKKITFQPNGSYHVSIFADKDIPFFVTSGFRPDVVTDGFSFKGALLIQSDDTVKTIEDGGLKNDETIGGVNVVASSDRYYTSVLYGFSSPLSVTAVADIHKNPTPYIEARKTIDLGGYVGPKYVQTLTSIDPRLKGVVEYGFFTFISRPMFTVLEWIEQWLGNWGWSIIVLTILIRVILFPLTFKGMVSMSKLKELTPKLNELRQKYKGDPQKLNIHMMELYKKHGANPLGGCLPLILQIPIFFAIYRVLLNAIELKGAPWILWIHDLSLLDHYYVLPILMGISMFLQQKITPTNFTDPMQEKIFKYLPVVFTVFFISFPAGLTLYWFINNVLSIVQQYAVNKLIEKHKLSESVQNG